MRIHINDELKYIGEQFAARSMQIYAVGGYVRNALIDLPHSDLDVCGPHEPDEIVAAFSGSDVKIIQKAVEFGTVELHFDLNGVRRALEYTTFRKDTYGPGGDHRPTHVIFSQNIEDDAFRRDFTVNALYASIDTGEVIDPTGGLVDLQNKLLRATNPDPSIIMRDDGLRALRLVRFACELGLNVEPNTRASAERFSRLLKAISARRIWLELRKILLSDARYGATQPTGECAHYRALREMIDLGLMQYIFPELLEGANVPQRSDYHAYDVLNHSLHSCEKSPPILTVRLAALLHDVAKPRCLAQTGAMLGHDALGAQMAREMLVRLHCENAVIERVCLLIQNHMLDLTGRAKENTIRKHFVSMGVDAAWEFIALREADFLGSGLLSPPIATAERYKLILQNMIDSNVPFDPNALAISGDEIMRALNIPPGRSVGEIKRRLWLHCAIKPADNSTPRLLGIAKGMRV